VALVLDRDVDVRVGGLDGALSHAEQVDLPARVEADVEEVVRARVEVAAPDRLARLGPRVAGAAGDLRIPLAGDRGTDGARLAHAGLGDAEVEAPRQGAAH